MVRDIKNRKELRGLGWKVLIVWECELRDKMKLIIRLKRNLKFKAK
jgi:DNA mismatch endonuclease (patch repair protein)